MGGHADRRTVYYGAVIHNDYVGIWQVFPAVYLYCHSTRTPVSYTHLDVYKRQAMQCNTSFVILDPKGEIVRDIGGLLEDVYKRQIY